MPPGPERAGAALRRIADARKSWRQRPDPRAAAESGTDGAPVPPDASVRGNRRENGVSTHPAGTGDVPEFPVIGWDALSARGDALRKKWAGEAGSRGGRTRREVRGRNEEASALPGASPRRYRTDGRSSVSRMRNAGGMQGGSDRARRRHDGRGNGGNETPGAPCGVSRKFRDIPARRGTFEPGVLGWPAATTRRREAGGFGRRCLEAGNIGRRSMIASFGGARPEDARRGENEGEP